MSTESNPAMKHRITMENLFLKIYTIMSIVIFFGTDFTYPLTVTSSIYTKEYVTKEIFNIGTTATAKILNCRCHCDYQTAANRLGQLHIHYERECDTLFKSLRGICIHKYQKNVPMKNSGCPETGVFAHCFVEVLFDKSYVFKSFHLQNAYYNVTINHNQTIIVPKGQHSISVNGLTYKVYVNEDADDVVGHFVWSYQNVHNNSDKWLEDCLVGTVEKKFTNSNQFNISQYLPYLKKLWPRLIYTGAVCVGDLSTLEFNNDEDNFVNDCKKIKQLDFDSVDGTLGYFYDQVDLVLLEMTDTDTTTTPPTPSTQSTTTIKFLTTTMEEIADTTEKVVTMAADMANYAIYKIGFIIAVSVGGIALLSVIILCTQYVLLRKDPAYITVGRETRIDDSNIKKQCETRMDGANIKQQRDSHIYHSYIMPGRETRIDNAYITPRREAPNDSFETFIGNSLKPRKRFSKKFLSREPGTTQSAELGNVNNSDHDHERP